MAVYEWGKDANWKGKGEKFTSAVRYSSTAAIYTAPAKKMRSGNVNHCDENTATSTRTPVLLARRVYRPFFNKLKQRPEYKAKGALKHLPTILFFLEYTHTNGKCEASLLCIFGASVFPLFGISLFAFTT